MEERTQKIAIENTGKDIITNSTKANIVLVHGACADGSSWSKVIPILQNAGHKVIAVQLCLHSLADDVATVKRTIDLIGVPVILVGHSYGGFVTTNGAYNNPNIKGLVYIAAHAPWYGIISVVEGGVTYDNIRTRKQYIGGVVSCLVKPARGKTYPIYESLSKCSQSMLLLRVSRC